jgi:Domain of unknown function (DUF5666)
MRPDIRQTTRRSALLLAAAFVLLAGCGGVDSGGTGVGQSGQPTYAAGPITGFGSIVVNGVRYDESMAEVFDDEGLLRSRDDLKLGMLTEVFASAVVSSATGSSATASAVRFGSQIIGRIDRVDVPGSRFLVLGQTVRVTTSTVFDAAAGGLAALAAGDQVEVFAQLDVSTQTYVATRIERRSNLMLYKLRGVVSALSVADKTITVGGQLISYAGLAVIDPATTLTIGTTVRVSLQTSRVGNAWVATSLMTGIGRVADRETAEVDGRIGAFTSTTQFVVNGITVDASAATFPNGSAGIVLGARVEVEGSIRNGVLVAQRVKLERDEDAAGFELQGTISASDSGNMTFVVRGVTVVYSSTTRFDSSTAADIVAGRKVEVRGVLSVNGTQLAATSIHVER